METKLKIFAMLFIVHGISSFSGEGFCKRTQARNTEVC